MDNCPQYTLLLDLAGLRLRSPAPAASIASRASNIAGSPESQGAPLPPRPVLETRHKPWRVQAGNPGPINPT